MPPSLQPEPDPAPGLDLEALRERLRSARSERGACPPWEELRADLLPGGGGRSGREARLAHRELCPYCDAHVREWERSFDKTSDALQAVEMHIARGVFEGARRLISLGSTRGAEDAPPRPDPMPMPIPAAPTPAPPPTYAAPTPAQAPPPSPPQAAPIVAPRMYAPPSERQERQEREYREERQERVEREEQRERPEPRPTPPAPVAPLPPAAPAAGIRLLVVEATAVERIPPSVFLCAQVLGAEVAHVGSIDELAGDPDLDAVCGIIFAGARPAAEWPEALHRGRDLAPGRPVLILTGGGVLPKGSTSKALRDALLSIDDPAELLLLALDPRLR